MAPPAAESLTASRKRRRIRLRSTAPPICRVTVKPTRTAPSSPRERACRTNARFADRTPLAAARKSPRRFSRSMTTAMLPRSGTEPLAPMRAAISEHFAAALCRHARAEAMPPFAHQFAGLIGPFHGFFSAARECGGSEVRIIVADTLLCGLLNQSHTRSIGLPVSL
jgi:hypothetical protein